MTRPPQNFAHIRRSVRRFTFRLQLGGYSDLPENIVEDGLCALITFAVERCVTVEELRQTFTRLLEARGRGRICEACRGRGRGREGVDTLSSSAVIVCKECSGLGWIGNAPAVVHFVTGDPALGAVACGAEPAKDRTLVLSPSWKKVTCSACKALETRESWDERFVRGTSDEDV